jgi:hypothetical protein
MLENGTEGNIVMTPPASSRPICPVTNDENQMFPSAPRTRLDAATPGGSSSVVTVPAATPW